MTDDKRKINLQDREKHISIQLECINKLLQLCMADFGHYLNDKNGINGKENEDE